MMAKPASNRKNLIRKRETMNYTRPEIVLAGAAMVEICGTSKGGQFTETPHLDNDSIAAYVADE